jgi:hypothetical protein
MAVGFFFLLFAYSASAAEVVHFHFDARPDAEMAKGIANEVKSYGFDCRESRAEVPSVADWVDKTGKRQSGTKLLSQSLPKALAKGESESFDFDVPPAALARGIDFNLTEDCSYSQVTNTPRQQCDVGGENCTTVIDTNTEPHESILRWHCSWSLLTLDPAQLPEQSCELNSRENDFDSLYKQFKKKQPTLMVSGALKGRGERLLADLCAPGAPASSRSILHLSVPKSADDRELSLHAGGARAVFHLGGDTSSGDVAVCGAGPLNVSVEGDKNFQSAAGKLDLKTGEHQLLHFTRATVMGRMFKSEELLDVAVARAASPAAGSVEPSAPAPGFTNPAK